MDILSSLSLEDADDYEFVPTSWLKSFISKPKDCKEMNTKVFLCFHKNLDFEKLHGLKVSVVYCQKVTNTKILLIKTFQLYSGDKLERLWKNIHVPSKPLARGEAYFRNALQEVHSVQVREVLPL